MHQLILMVLRYKVPPLGLFKKEVIQLYGYAKFIDFFDHIWVVEPYDDDLEILKSKFIATVNVNYPRDVFHNFFGKHAFNNTILSYYNL